MPRERYDDPVSCSGGALRDRAPAGAGVMDPCGFRAGNCQIANPIACAPSGPPWITKVASETRWYNIRDSLVRYQCPPNRGRITSGSGPQSLAGIRFWNRHTISELLFLLLLGSRAVALMGVSTHLRGDGLYTLVRARDHGSAWPFVEIPQRPDAQEPM